VKLRDLPAIEISRLPSRMNPGSEKGLCGEDIAQSRQAILIHQEGLDGQTGAFQKGPQAPGCESLRQRLHAEPRESCLGSLVQDSKRAQPARIHK
jgi:hypothetical protein